MQPILLTGKLYFSGLTSFIKRGKLLKISVSIFRSRESDDKIVTYPFKTSNARYQTEPLFLPAGVYDVAVAALQWADVPYTLALDEKRIDDIELEKNDATAKATPMKLNTAYELCKKDSFS